MNKFNQIVLLILDGFGISSNFAGNPINLDSMPAFKQLWREYPNLLLSSGITNKIRPANSLSCQTRIGVGQMIDDIYFDFENKVNGDNLKSNSVITDLASSQLHSNKTVNIIFCLTDSGIIDHINHAIKLICTLSNLGILKFNIHLIIDGRDNIRSTLLLFSDLNAILVKNNIEYTINSVVGRDKVLDSSYLGPATKAKEYIQFLTSKSARKGLTLTNIINSLNSNSPFIPLNTFQPIGPSDCLLFIPWRIDMTKSLFDSFQILLSKHINVYSFNKNISSTPTASIIDNIVTYNSILDELAKSNIPSIIITESIKQFSMTWGFSGQKFAQSETKIFRSIDPLSNIKMRSEDILKYSLKLIDQKLPGLIVLNIPNLDVIAHSGNYELTSRTGVIVDNIVSKLSQRCLLNSSLLLITSDHGNAEEMVGKSTIGRAYHHTSNPAFLMSIYPNSNKNLIKSSLIDQSVINDTVSIQYNLADISPTILDVFGLPISNTFTGRSLLSQLGINSTLSN